MKLGKGASFLAIIFQILYVSSANINEVMQIHQNYFSNLSFAANGTRRHFDFKFKRYLPYESLNKPKTENKNLSLLSQWNIL